MGSSVSPIIANIVMEDIKKRAFNNLMFEMPFYYRHADDIAGQTKRRLNTRILEHKKDILEVQISLRRFLSKIGHLL